LREQRACQPDGTRLNSNAINMTEYIITIFATIVFLIVFTVYMTNFKNSGLKVVEDWAKKEGHKITGLCTNLRPK